MKQPAALEGQADAFRLLWLDGYGNGPLADYFGVSVGAAGRFALSLGLHRGKGGRTKPGPIPKDALQALSDTSAQDQVRLDRLAWVRVCGQIPMPDFWTFERDLAVVAVKGAYAELSALATEWEQPMQRLIGRWHVLRPLMGSAI